MELGIQMGYGSKEATVDLLRRWGGGFAVLSPRVFQTPKRGSLEDRIADTAATLRKSGGRILFDPMLYEQKSPLRRISSLDYCSAMGKDLRSNYRSVVDRIVELNRQCNTDRVVLPSCTTSSMDTEWNDLQNGICEYARTIAPDASFLSTVAIKPETLSDIDSLSLSAERINLWNTDGVFLACEHPENDYLTDNPLWLCNLALLVAWIKRSGKTVFVGYASHQMLPLVLARCDCIFSGNFLNMRRFKTEDFNATSEDSGPSKRATWYYAPHLFSEFRVVSLDIAYQTGVLDKLATPDSEAYASVLFGGQRPSTTGYKERDSFRHYLHCLHSQCRQFSLESYESSKAALQLSYSNAEALIDGLKRRGVYDRDRSFSGALPATLQAMEAFDHEIGKILSIEWEI